MTATAAFTREAEPHHRFAAAIVELLATLLGGGLIFVALVTPYRSSLAIRKPSFNRGIGNDGLVP